MSKPIPYANRNLFPFNVHPMNTLPGGTDESVPLDHVCKFQFSESNPRFCYGFFHSVSSSALNRMQPQCPLKVGKQITLRLVSISGL